MRPDLEEDILNCPEIMAKLQQENRYYAQNLYCAWCNMQWCKQTTWNEKAGDLGVLDISEDNLWSASWRASGGIVARLRNQNEDYMDYYCSGIKGGMSYDVNDDNDYFAANRYVSEGEVTEEIKADLAKLGWFPVPYKDDFV
jgi:hypothetical protein